MCCRLLFFALLRSSFFRPLPVVRSSCPSGRPCCFGLCVSSLCILGSPLRSPSFCPSSSFVLRSQSLCVFRYRRIEDGRPSVGVLAVNTVGPDRPRSDPEVVGCLGGCTMAPLFAQDDLGNYTQGAGAFAASAQWPGPADCVRGLRIFRLWAPAHDAMRAAEGCIMVDCRISHLRITP